MLSTSPEQDPSREYILYIHDRQVLITYWLMALRSHPGHSEKEALTKIFHTLYPFWAENLELQEHPTGGGQTNHEKAHRQYPWYAAVTDLAGQLAKILDNHSNGKGSSKERPIRLLVQDMLEHLKQYSAFLPEDIKNNEGKKKKYDALRDEYYGIIEQVLTTFVFMTSSAEKLHRRI